MNTKLQLFLKNPLRKATFLALLCIVFTGKAASLNIDNNYISLNLTNVNITKIFSAIEEKTELTFVFDSYISQNTTKYNLNIQNKNIKEVIQILTEETGFNYELLNHTITVIPSKVQDKVVQGKITDNQGVPLAGATVIVKGTSYGTISDFDGNFNFKVEDFPVTIVFSFMGFERKEVVLTQSEFLNVSLTQSDNALNEVVVTALGIKREEKKLGYAQQTVVSQELTDARPNNWSDALRGKVPGLNINGLGGPISSQQIVLRGNASLDPGNNGALIVIDGIPVQNEFPGSGASNGYMGGDANNDTPVDFGNAISDLNPEDIESISVLKGPAASALYGYQAANGAVIVTTKSGKRNKGLGITYSSNVKFDKITRWPDWQYEYGQGSGKGSYLKPEIDENGNPRSYNDRLYYSYGASEDGNSTAGSSSAFGPKFDGQYYYQYDPYLEGQGAKKTLWKPYKDNRKDFWQTGKTYTQNLSIQGSNEKGSMRSSLTHTENEWIMPNTGFEQLSFSFNGDQQISDKVNLKAVANYRHKTSDNLPGQGYNNHSIAYFMIFQNPNVDLDWYRPIWKNGQEQLDMIRPYSSYIDNPFAMAYEIQNSLDQHAVTGNLSADIKLNTNLNLMVRGALNMYNKNMKQQRPYDINRYSKGYYRKTNVFKNETNIDFLLTYDKDFGDFDVTANLGGNRMDYNYLRQDSWADGLEIPGQYNLVNGTETFTSEFEGKNKVNSLYSLVSLGYKDIAFLDITGRNDWNSMLPKHNQSYFFPSASASIMLSEIFSMAKPISFTKLRASVAQVGGAGQYSNRYRTKKYYGRTDFSGSAVAPTSLYNTDFKPEITTSKELGVDVRMFKGRLRLDATVYQNNTKNQILSTPLPRSSGYSSVLINAGEVRNRGVEFLLNVTPIKLNNFKWNTTLTWAKNEGKVLSLHDNAEEGILQMLSSSGAQLVAEEGGSPAALYGRAFLRSPNGDVIYNNKGIPQMTDGIVKIGDTQPKWVAGFINSFQYKNLRLNMVIDGKYGGKIYSHTHHKLTQQGKLKHTLKGRETGELIGNGVVDNGDGTYSLNTTPLAIADYYNLHYPLANTEANSFDASFVKLREVTLEYSFTQETLKNTFLSELSLSVYGRNLAVISDFPIYDPEVSGLAGGTNLHPGVEVGQMPVASEFGMNIKVGF